MGIFFDTICLLTCENRRFPTLNDPLSRTTQQPSADGRRKHELMTSFGTVDVTSGYMDIPLHRTWYDFQARSAGFDHNGSGRLPTDTLVLSTCEKSDVQLLDRCVCYLQTRANLTEAPTVVSVRHFGNPTGNSDRLSLVSSSKDIRSTGAGVRVKLGVSFVPTTVQHF
jgi:hypothetical protein